jgi:diguanylate cyclase (GGDEF)-like protein/PAS domain S-box-containing protein
MSITSYQSLSDYIDLLLDAICVVDEHGRFEFVSAGAERIFGYSADEMRGRQMLELVHPDDRERTLQTANEINGGAIKVDFENRYIHKDGRVVHLLWSARWSQADQRRIAVARDITCSKQAEMRQTALYAISEAAFASDNLPALYQRIHQIIAGLMPLRRFAIVLADDNGDLSFSYNHTDVSLQSDLSEPEITDVCKAVIRRAEAILLSVDHGGGLPARIKSVIAAKCVNWLGVPLKSQHSVIGTLMVQNDASAPCYSSNEKDLLEYVSVQVVVAIERKQMLARLQRNALYDHLTQLPNRELLHDRLQLALLRAEREGGQFALLYLDLDRFKQINDSFGHQVGDELLQQSALRIQHCVRQSDTVARFGGDEFVILLQQVDNDSVALHLAEKVRQALNHPFVILEQQLQVFPSIGVALFPKHSDSVKSLLLSADNAMYTAKKAGGNKVMLSSVKR